LIKVNLWFPSSVQAFATSAVVFPSAAQAIDRRQERASRRREHLAKLNRRSPRSTIGLVVKDDSVSKGRKPGSSHCGIRPQRTQVALDSAGNEAISPDMLKTFACMARERIRLDNGGYRRDHLRALAQRVEVADKEVRVMGSKSELLRTLVAVSGGKPGVAGVQSSVCPS
jgi:hypothetical protein